MHKDKLPQCRIYVVLDAQEGFPYNLVHCQACRALRWVLNQRNICSKVDENIQNWGGSGQNTWEFVPGGLKSPGTCLEG